MIAVIPFTRFLVGTTIGNNATIVPLVLAAAPFVARLVGSSLLRKWTTVLSRSRPEHGRHNLANCKQGSSVPEALPSR